MTALIEEKKEIYQGHDAWFQFIKKFESQELDIDCEIIPDNPNVEQGTDLMKPIIYIRPPEFDTFIVQQGGFGSNRYVASIGFITDIHTGSTRILGSLISQTLYFLQRFEWQNIKFDININGTEHTNITFYDLGILIGDIRSMNAPIRIENNYFFQEIFIEYLQTR